MYKHPLHIYVKWQTALTKEAVYQCNMLDSCICIRVFRMLFAVGYQVANITVENIFKERW
jgi:hypothetical protein